MMSYCLNPECHQSQNSPKTEFCLNCGAKLLLKARYRPQQFLGRGGFGRTFLAIDQELPSQPRCVVKQFYFYDRDPEIYHKALELFRQEAARLDELGKHAQIPSLFAFFEQEQRLYLVQEYIDGLSLKQELELQVYQEPQIWQLLLNLLPVLQYIHERRVIHRDIKPENIIRRYSDHKPVLIDFGIAKVLTDTALLRPATVIGSQDYIAPEQTRGKVFPASDLYSLGVTCIRLLTKVPPLDLYDFDQECWFWREYLPKGTVVSEALAKILDKMLQPTLGKRYQEAGDILQEIPQSYLELDDKGELATSVMVEPREVQSQLLLNFTETQTLEQTEIELFSPINLVSEAGVNYRNLKDLLAAKQWKAADAETGELLCQALSFPSGTAIQSHEISRLPCEDLLLLDQLWRHYSQGQFGLSVQMQIYQAVNSDYLKFCNRVGWPTYNSAMAAQQLKFSLQAPQGHLPSRSWVGGTLWLRHLEVMTARLMQCRNP